LLEERIRLRQDASMRDQVDHVVVFGEVVEASLLREGEPSTHVRKNGLGY
jgi:hypothetical protein